MNKEHRPNVNSEAKKCIQCGKQLTKEHNKEWTQWDFCSYDCYQKGGIK